VIRDAETGKRSVDKQGYGLKQPILKVQTLCLPSFRGQHPLTNDEIDDIRKTCTGLEIGKDERTLPPHFSGIPIHDFE